ncbi:MAG: Uma2 family endonuclease [Chloroflexota bacterium]
MAVELKRHRFTRAEYHRMAETGILSPDARVELIDGEIVEMSPIGSRHLATVGRLTHLFVPAVGRSAIVLVQGSIALSEDGEPEPDVVLLRYREDFYADDHPSDEAVLLIVEVADTSEAYDRRTKAPLYARHGIPELWLVDLNRDLVTRFTEPGPDGYASTRIFRRGESLSPLAFPDLQVAVDAILGARR